MKQRSIQIESIKQKQPLIQFGPCFNRGIKQISGCRINSSARESQEKSYRRGDI